MADRSALPLLTGKRKSQLYHVPLNCFTISVNHCLCGMLYVGKLTIVEMPDKLSDKLVGLSDVGKQST